MRTGIVNEARGRDGGRASRGLSLQALTLKQKPVHSPDRTARHHPHGASVPRSFHRARPAAPLLASFALGCRSPAPGATAGVAPAGASAEITAADLRARLTLYAADSMLGRKAGEIGNYKATEYLAAEARRLGLEPAGDSGGYFQ